jgi:hypothetical protein
VGGGGVGGEVVGGVVGGGGVVGAGGGVLTGGGLTESRQRVDALRLLHFFFVLAECTPRFLADTDACGTATPRASALPATSRTAPMPLLALML